MRSAISLLFRIYAYLYHFVLTLFLLGIGFIAASTGNYLRLGMLPWTGEKLTQVVLVLGVVGLLCVMLAVTGLLRWLFPIWALVAAILMLRGFFLTPYTFSGSDQFRGAVWLTIGAWAAFLCSLTVLHRRKRPYKA